MKETLHRRILKSLLPNKTMRLKAQQKLISNINKQYSFIRRNQLRQKPHAGTRNLLIGKSGEWGCQWILRNFKGKKERKKERKRLFKLKLSSIDAHNFKRIITTQQWLLVYHKLI